MNGRALGFCVALAVGLLAVPRTQACIQIDPRVQLEFAEGSAELVRGQSDLVADLFLHLEQPITAYRVSVRGYADRPVGFDAKAWRPEDVALARQRADAIARVARLLGAPCVETVALGSAPDDAPPAREDAAGTRWIRSGVLVLAKPDSHDTPPEGVTLDTQCGPPAAAGASD